MMYIVYTAHVSLDWDTRLRPIAEWTFHGKLICAMATYPIVNHNGVIELSLWELMQIFGPRIHMGMPHMFFVDNEIEVIK